MSELVEQNLLQGIKNQWSGCVQAEGSRVKVVGWGAKWKRHLSEEVKRQGGKPQCRVITKTFGRRVPVILYNALLCGQNIIKVF
jgi:hypothetical protein